MVTPVVSRSVTCHGSCACRRKRARVHDSLPLVQYSLSRIASSWSSVPLKVSSASVEMLVPSMRSAPARRALSRYSFQPPAPVAL